MKKLLLAAILAGVASYTSNANAADVAQTQPLSDVRAEQIAFDIVQYQLDCEVLDAIRGMDKTLTVQALQMISSAAEKLSPGSIAVTTINGDADNVLVVLYYVKWQQPNTRNQVVHYTLFSKAHPLVDETNSVCMF